MDEKQQVEPTGDIHDALASMMAVEPSLGFAARVRQRIAADADAREWKPVALVVPALAAVAVVVLGILLIFTGSRRIAPERLMPGSARVSEPGPVMPAPWSGPAAVVAIQPEQPPIPLVPKNEIVTMQRLLSAAQADRFQFELVPAGVPVADHLSPPEPISVPSIELMPIGANSSSE